MVTPEYLPALFLDRVIRDVILMNHATGQFSSALSCVGCWNYQRVKRLPMWHKVPNKEMHSCFSAPGYYMFGSSLCAEQIMVRTKTTRQQLRSLYDCFLFTFTMCLSSFSKD
jgi:hypothetical protein